MTPVISPWVFYLMPLAERLSLLTLLLGVFGIIVSFITIACIIEERDSVHPNEYKINSYEKIKRLAVAIGITSIILTIFIPREKTLTKMIVAQNVTYERVETVADTVETVYNDIMELFEED